MGDQVMCSVTVEKKGEYPLGGPCNSSKVIYQTCISPMEYDNDRKRVHIAISAENRKQGLYNHRHFSPT